MKAEPPSPDHSDPALTPTLSQGERAQSLSLLQSVLSLPRTVWLLAAISLVNDAASDMIYPLVPLYLASVLMAGPKALGVIEGIAEAVSSVIKLFGRRARRSLRQNARVGHRRLCDRGLRAAADRPHDELGRRARVPRSPIASARACARRRAMR